RMARRATSSAWLRLPPRGMHTRPPHCADCTTHTVAPLPRAPHPNATRDQDAPQQIRTMASPTPPPPGAPSPTVPPSASAPDLRHHPGRRAHRPAVVASTSSRCCAAPGTAVGAVCHTRPVAVDPTKLREAVSTAVWGLATCSHRELTELGPELALPTP